MNTDTEQKIQFSINDLVVCPIHGMGKVVDITYEVILDCRMQFYIIEILSKEATLRIPVNRIENSGIRAIKDKSCLQEIFDFLGSTYVQKNKVVWNKKHLQYEEKVNSVDLLEIISVVKDLYHTKNKADENLMTFSEKNIYSIALQKVAQEIGMIMDLPLEKAKDLIINALDSVYEDSTA